METLYNVTALNDNFEVLVMQKRKSFLLRTSLLATLPDMSDEQSAQLFRAIYSYVLDEPTSPPVGMNNLWREIRYQLDDNKIAYDNKVKANKKNGKKGGRPVSKLSSVK